MNTSNISDNSEGNNEISSTPKTERLDLETVMESIVRISFAGLGGSILGLGQKRRLDSMRVLTGSAATAAARRKRSPNPQVMNLPWTMALSCMAFVSIMETSRLTSPSYMILQGQHYYDHSSVNDSSLKAMITIADFSIGGAVAGIAGSIGKTSQKRLLPVATAFRGSKRFFGLVPGIALGVTFGALQAAADYTIDYLEGKSEEKSSARIEPTTTKKE